MGRERTREANRHGAVFLETGIKQWFDVMFDACDDGGAAVVKRRISSVLPDG
jgi:hypothetical protein